MSRDTHYYYDRETCSFVKVEPTWKRWVKPLSVAAGLVCVLTALIVGAIDAQWLATPEEQALKTENQVLERQLRTANERMEALAGTLETLSARDRTLYRTLFEMEPISEDVRQVGVGGSDPYESFARFDESTAELLQGTARMLDKLERQASLQNASYRELTRMAESREERLRQLPAIRPANGPIVSGYGMRHHPVLKVRKMHSGVDFLLRTGSPVVATADGVVKRTGRSATYGKHIDVRHEAAGYVTRYAHLSEIDTRVRQGASVERGQRIGLSGNTGRSTGPHLHYEVRDLDGRSMDPMRFFVPDMTPEEYHRLEQRTDTQHAQADSLGAPMDAAGDEQAG